MELMQQLGMELKPKEGRNKKLYNYGVDVSIKHSTLTRVKVGLLAIRFFVARGWIVFSFKTLKILKKASNALADRGNLAEIDLSPSDAYVQKIF